MVVAMPNRFTDLEIGNLHLLGRMLAQARWFATSQLNKAGKQYLFEILDAAHNIPAALLNPNDYNISDDVEQLRVLLDKMNDPSFLES